MVILSLSPRSYVTEGFTILYSPLSEYVCKTLAKTENDWWYKYIWKTAPKIFTVKHDCGELPEKGNLSTFRKYFDELALFKLISHENLAIISLYNPMVVELSKKLRKIRDDWAHRDWKRNQEKRHSFEWADSALTIMRKLAGIITSSDVALANNDAGLRIRVLQEQMNIDESNRRYELIGKPDDLKHFIDSKVLIENEKRLNTGETRLNDEEKDKMQRKINSTRDMLDVLETAEGVIAFFWDAIMYKSDSYNLTKKFGVSFEDVRDDFDKLCYGQDYQRNRKLTKRY